MIKKILFTPIGGTDPISNFRDGAMLHICRHLKPDKVYLYMSKEMIDFHNKDNRYLYCLDKLGELLNHQFDVEVIKKEDLVEVQRFDFFYNEFRKYIKNIRSEYPEAELILNVSSGTPAMKGALQTLATLAEFEFCPIQVTTPRKKINKHEEDRNNYDVETYWELNEDNNPNEEIRCIKSETPCLMAEIKKEIIVKHIDAYDYSAAKTVALSIKEHLSENVINLLEAAVCRTQLNFSGMQKALKNIECNLLPINDGHKGIIFEHYMWLVNEVKKENYASFVRGVTPLILDLLENIVENNLKIKINDYVTERLTPQKVAIRYWDLEKIQKNQEIYDIFMSAYNNNFKETFVSYNQLATLIEGKSNNPDLVDRVKKIKLFEENIRNHAAHEIISVTQEWINKRLGSTPTQLLKDIKRLAEYGGINIKDEYLNTYNEMNELIKKELYS